MKRFIKYEFLNKTELEYEVKIRCEEPANTVLLLKKQVLRLVENSHPEDILTSPIPIEDDLSQIDSTLTYLDCKIKKFLQGETKYLRLIETFINHVFYRLERIDTDLYPDFKAIFDTLKMKYDDITKQFESLTPAPTENDPPSLDPPVDPTVMELPLVSQTSVQVHTPYSSPPPQSFSPNNVFKDLKRHTFNGKSCPRYFLQKLQEYCLARGLSKDLLISQAFEIFTDNALHWFRFKYNQNPNLTWNELSSLLIKDFGGFDYDYKLLEAIRNRTQGRDEPIVIYISIMSGMFSRLSKKLSETEQLEIILRNIRPCYSVFVALKDIDSIDFLLATCQNYEKFLDRDKQFKEPNVQQSPLISEFNYKHSTSSSVDSPNSSNNSRPSPLLINKFTSSYKYPSRQVNSLSQTKAPQESSFCVRCRKQGHSLNTCTQPRFVICFKCGLKGFKTADCPTCSPKPNTSSKKLTADLKSNLNFDNDDWTNWIKTIQIFFSYYKISSTLYSKEQDLNRPFVNVKIYNLTLSGLLDSGSLVTILGNNSYLEILKLGCKLFKSDLITVSTANNEKVNSLGYFDLPVHFNNQTHLIKAYVFPEIFPSLILGIDFWKKFNLLPSVLSSLNFTESKCSAIETKDTKVLPYEHLTPNQNNIANDIIQRFKTISFEEKGILGSTHLITHKIDTGDSLPIKQRCYRLSPVK
ncbi:unnamed protein product [Parnassius mnemosyne]|uniref:Retrotransposon gag domain-containing protein n=1 Tax=Parnassius mnemosyne TaxID=213953 RepID=A0AAV1LI95_9NEOP